MSDKKITELNAATTLVDTDIAPVVTGVATVPETKKITIANLKASIQKIIQSAGVAQTYRPILNFTNAMVSDNAGNNSTDVYLPTTIQNHLINGGFDFAQRQVPATLTTITTDKYGADRWRTSSQSASLQYQRNDATGETGITCLYYGSFKQITNSGKFMVYQIVEGINSIPLRGKTVTFSIYMKASSAKTIRMNVIELQTAGTMDSIPATFVAGWNGNTNDPTLNTNLAYIGTSVSKSVTTSWASYSVTVTIPTNSKNVICAVWADSQFSANDILSVAEAGLYMGSIAPTWTSRPIQQELAMCQRYYQKSYDKDTAPATASISGGLSVMTVISPTANGATYGTTRYHVPIRLSTSTPTAYGYAGGASKVSIAAVEQAATSGAVTFFGENSFAVYNASGGNVVGSQIQWHYSVDSEL